MEFIKYLKQDNSHFFSWTSVPFVGQFKNCDYKKTTINDDGFYNFYSPFFAVSHSEQWHVMSWAMLYPWQSLISWLSLILCTKQPSQGCKWQFFSLLSPGFCNLIMLILNFFNSSTSDSLSYQNRDNQLFLRLLKLSYFKEWDDLGSFWVMDSHFRFFFFFSSQRLPTSPLTWFCIG